MLWRSALLAALLLAATASANVSFGPAPSVAGEPGQYVTFAVPVNADGQVTVSVASPSGWSLVSDTRTLSVSGSFPVPFTLRIPGSALLGTTAQLQATASTPEGDLTTTDITVTVTGSTGTGLAEPAELTAAPGEVLSFTVTVTNEANQPDTILLSASNASRRVLVSPERLELGPFQSGEVTVTVPVEGTVNDGYRFRIRLEAWSRVAGSSTVRTIQATYTSGSSRIPLQQRDPQLVLSITTAASAGVERTAGESDPFFNWSVTPGLHGELSDFVELSVRSGSFTNTAGSTFSVPSHSDISLQAENWDAALNLGPGQVRLAGSLRAADWRFSVSGQRQSAAERSWFNLGLGAVSSNPDLDLQFSGNLLLSEGMHAESLGVMYRRQLTETLSLGTGVSFSGSAADGAEYQLYASFNQTLTLLTQGFSLTQAVSTTPGLGLTNVSVIGGSRSSYPLGVRFMSRLALTPRASHLTTAVQLLSTPVSWLRLSTGVVHQTTDFGAAGLLRLQFGVGLRFASQSRFSGSVQLDAETLTALDDYTQSGSRFRIRFRSSIGRLALTAGVTSERRLASLNAPASASLAVEAGAVLLFAEGSTLEAILELERSQLDTFRFSVRWRQRWSVHLDSDVTMAFSQGGHDLSLGLSVRDVFTQGLRFGIGYGLDASGGTITHRFSAGVSYTWRIPFRTPRPVVELFGGRETGALRGTAFTDTNRNGLREPGEPPLAGILVNTPEYSTVTGEDGSFTLRLPEGQHELSFGGSLPATLGFIGASTVAVRNGAELALDLPFAPVSTMQVAVFLDGDRDGMRGPGEPLITGAALELSGPLSRRVVTSAEGSSWLSGLIEGDYAFTVDAATLPPGFVLTKPVPAIQVRPPANPAPLLVPVAPMIREMRTTFTSGAIAMTASVSQSSAVAGDEIRVTVNAQGPVETVTVELFGRSTRLEQVESRWEGTITVPEAVSGLQTGTAVASGADQAANAQLQVFIRPSP